MAWITAAFVPLSYCTNGLGVHLAITLIIYRPTQESVMRSRISARQLLDRFRADELDVPGRDICEILLKGYADGLRTGGDPYVLGGRHDWLHRLRAGDPRKQEQYWRKLLTLPVTRK